MRCLEAKAGRSKVARANKWPRATQKHLLPLTAICISYYLSGHNIMGHLEINRLSAIEEGGRLK